jgi:hypothetical protein
MCHKIDMRRLNARGGAQGLLDVVLARGAGHAQHGERYRFCGVWLQLLFQMCRISGLGESRDSLIDRGGLGSRGEPRGSHANFVYRYSGNRCKCLICATHTRTAVHSVNM